jgi:hypothetical protein
MNEAWSLPGAAIYIRAFISTPTSFQYKTINLGFNGGVRLHKHIRGLQRWRWGWEGRFKIYTIHVFYRRWGRLPSPSELGKRGTGYGVIVLGIRSAVWWRRRSKMCINQRQDETYG